MWRRAQMLMSENLQLLIAVAGVFLLLPSALIFFVLIPPGAELQGPMDVLTNPDASEELIKKAVEKLMELMTPFMLWSAVLNVVQHVGYGAMMAVMGRARPTVGEALATGAKAVLPVVLALLLYFSTFFALAIIISVILSPAGAGAATFIATILTVLIGMFLVARLSLTLPAMVLENRLNPIAAMTRSWRLTGVSSGNVFGFWMLVIVCYFVIGIIVSSVGSLIAAAVESEGVQALIQGLFSGGFAMAAGIVVSACAVSMFHQLDGHSASEPASDSD